MKILFIVLLICIIAGFFLYEKKRANQLAQFAQNAGFSLQKGQQRLPKALDEAGFYLFTQGSPYAANIMQGSRNNYQITLLEYFFDAGFGDEGDRYLPNSDNDGQVENHAQLVAWVQSNALSLPEFDLSPTDSPVRSAAARAGYLPVSFDNAPAFNNSFKLAGRNPQALRGIFNEQLRTMLLRHPDWVIESRGSQWLFYQPDLRTSSSAISGWLDGIQLFLDQAAANAG